MDTYSPPCFERGCKSPFKCGPNNLDLCSALGKEVMAAGGGHLLEVGVCPFDIQIDNPHLFDPMQRQPELAGPTKGTAANAS